MTQHSLFIVVCWEQTHLTQHHATVILHCKPHSCSHHTSRTHSWPSYSHSWGALERLSKQMRAVSSGESIITASCKPQCGCLGVSSRNRGGPSLHWYVVDYSAETLLTILKTRILPSTTIISNCWGVYVHLSDEEPREGSRQPEQQKDILHLLPHWVLGTMCHAHHLNPFTMFIHIIRNADWWLRPVHQTVGRPPPLCASVVSS
jgi:hypothetical protein